MVEKKKAEELSHRLGIHIDEKQIILSHTPMQPLASKYADCKVLVLGCREVDEVARSYGFKRVYTINDIAQDEPSRYPFFDFDHRPHLCDEEWGAVLIMHGKCP